MKNFLKTNRLGKYNEEAVKERKMQRAKERKEELDKAQTMEIGDRCQVRNFKKYKKIGIKNTKIYPPNPVQRYFLLIRLQMFFLLGL